MLCPFTGPWHFLRAFVPCIHQGLHVRFRPLARLRFVGLITDVIIDQLRLVPVAIRLQSRQLRAVPCVREMVPPHGPFCQGLRGGAHAPVAIWHSPLRWERPRRSCSGMGIGPPAMWILPSWAGVGHSAASRALDQAPWSPGHRAKSGWLCVPKSAWIVDVLCPRQAGWLQRCCWLCKV